MAYRAYLTAAALAANLASVAPGGDPVELGSIAIGDAGGVAYEPDGSELDLVNEVAEAEITSIEVDPTNPLQLLITAVFTAEIGGFVVREAAVRFEDGSLYAIANVPPTTKPDPETDGAAVELVITLVVAYDGDANVVINVDPSIVYATQEWVWSHRHFFAVVSATITAPPGAPAISDHYLVPTGATGAWAGQAAKVAIWRNLTDGWLFVSPPLGAMVGAGDTDAQYQLTAAGWVEVGSAGVAAINVAGSSDVVATVAQASKATLALTGALTGNINLVLPTRAGRWNIRNGTSGAYTVTAKTAAGTGVAVSQGFAADVIGDGTNIIAAATDLKGNASNALDVLQAAPVASAATVDLGAIKGNVGHVTGTTGIGSFGNSLGSRAGAQRVTVFDGALTLTHSANLILPKAVDFLTATGDVLSWSYEGIGVWRCTGVMRASGLPVALGPNKLKCQVFTTSGTFTPEAGVTDYYLRFQGPGGGGAAPIRGSTAVGPGGGAGGYCEGPITGLTTPQTVTIGAPGAGGPAPTTDGVTSDGTAGGTSTFGALATVNGGGAGTGTVGFGVGGTATMTGGVAIQGGSAPGMGTFSPAGLGGAPPGGLGTGGLTSGAGGKPPTPPGYGGGGAGSTGNGDGVGEAGGDGAPSIAIVIHVGA